jgi:hypothetical protein
MRPEIKVPHELPLDELVSVLNPDGAFQLMPNGERFFASKLMKTVCDLRNALEKGDGSMDVEQLRTTAIQSLDRTFKLFPSRQHIKRLKEFNILGRFNENNYSFTQKAFILCRDVLRISPDRQTDPMKNFLDLLKYLEIK